MFFVASFQTPSNSEMFSVDTNGNLPKIGRVAAGAYHSAIINGTVFENAGYQDGKLYLCTNTPAIDRVTGERIVITNSKTGAKELAWNTEVVSEISTLDFIRASKELGEAKRIPAKSVTTVESVDGTSGTSATTPTEVVLDLEEEVA